MSSQTYVLQLLSTHRHFRSWCRAYGAIPQTNEEPGGTSRRTSRLAWHKSQVAQSGEANARIRSRVPSSSSLSLRPMRRTLSSCCGTEDPIVRGSCEASCAARARADRAPRVSCNASRSSVCQPLYTPLLASHIGTQRVGHAPLYDNGCNQPKSVVS